MTLSVRGNAMKSQTSCGMWKTRLAVAIMLLLPMVMSCSKRQAAIDNYNRGVAALEAGDYDLAITCFDEAIRIDPKLAKAYTNRGFVYNEMGEYDRAITDCTEAIRLDDEETRFIARQLAGKLNVRPGNIRVLIPMKGWSEADREGGPLYDPEMRDAFIQALKNSLDSGIEIRETDLHINDPAFAGRASRLMDEMVRGT